MTMPRVCRYCLARLTDMEREFCSKKDCRCYARIDARAPKGGYEIGQVAMPKDRLLSMIDRDLSIQKDLGVLTSLTLLATKVRKYVWDDCSAFLGERNEIVDRARRASTSPQLAPGETASYDKTTGTWRVTPSVSPSQTRDQISIFDDRPRPLAADAAPAFHVDASGRDIASKECKCDSGGPDHSPTMPHVPCRVCGRRYLGTSVHGSLNGCGRTDCPVLPQEPTLPTFQTTKVYDDVIVFPLSKVKKGEIARLLWVADRIFRGSHLVIPSDVASAFEIRELLVGKDSNWKFGKAMPGSAFAEGEVPHALHMDTVVPGIYIQIFVKNLVDYDVPFTAKLHGSTLK